MRPEELYCPADLLAWVLDVVFTVVGAQELLLLTHPDGDDLVDDLKNRFAASLMDFIDIV